MRETFEPSASHGGHDGDGRGVRYLEWTHDPDPDGHTYRADYAFLLRERDGEVRVVYDTHVCGLFSRDEWLTACHDAGLEAEVRRLVHTDFGETHALLYRAV